MPKIKHEVDEAVQPARSITGRPVGKISVADRLGTDASKIHSDMNGGGVPLKDPPLPQEMINFLKAFHGLDAPYTLAEVEKMFPGLYTPVKH
jgi:hypothetical protein